MINQEQYTYNGPTLGNMIDMVDAIQPKNRIQSRELFEHAGTVIINRPHQFEANFLNKVVDFLVRYHKEFQGVFEDEFLAKALNRIFANFDKDLADEIRTGVLHKESSMDVVNYLDLFSMRGVTADNFVASYESFYKNLNKQKSKDEDKRDFRNFIESIMIALTFANKVDDAEIHTPIENIKGNIRERLDKLNAEDMNDPILQGVYMALTDPNLTTGRYEVPEEDLEVLREKNTDPVNLVDYQDKVNETVADFLETDENIGSDGLQKMHLHVSLEKLIANAQEFSISTWSYLSNKEIVACIRNYEDCLHAIDACWDWKQWQLKPSFDLRNLDHVYQVAKSSFDACLKDLIRLKEPTVTKEHNPKFVGVSLNTYTERKEIEEFAEKIGLNLKECSEDLPLEQDTRLHFRGTIVAVAVDYPGEHENPAQWSFEPEQEIPEELKTTDLDRGSLAELLSRDSAMKN